MENKEKHKRRGLIATIIFHTLMVIAFVFLGLTYQDPPPEEGIAINFGYEDDGSGNTTQAPQKSTPPPTEPEPIEEQIEDVATQDVEDAPAVTEEKPKQKPTEKPVEKPKEEPQPDPEPKPSDRLNNALNSTKNSQDASGQGEGETKGGGDQGDRNGDVNSPNRTGGAGQGNGNYNLNGRSALAKPKPKYDCTEEGRVIVKVRVNREGKTISAEPGVNMGKYKTNTAAPCLLKRAKEAALKTTWSAKSDATTQQTGFIIYNFTKK